MSDFWEMISLNLLPNKWVNPLPGVNDQHSVIKSVRGFCRCVEWEELSWQWDRDAGPRPAHLTSIVSVSVLSPTRVRASPRFLPLTFWLWFRLWCPPSLSSNKNKSRPGPASLGGGSLQQKLALSDCGSGSETVVWGGHCDTGSGWQPDHDYLLECFNGLWLVLSVMWV